MSEEEGLESPSERSSISPGRPSESLPFNGLPSTARSPEPEEERESTTIPDGQDRDKDIDDDDEDFDSDWEEEDIQLFRELREYSERTKSQINVSSVTSTSLIEDPANLQSRVRKLQQDVIEWKALYDDLMQDFRSLKLKTVVEKEELIKEVKALKNKSGDTKESARKLQAELLEHKKLLRFIDTQNRFLLKEVNKLRKERGMREVELEQFSDQVNSLNKDSMLGRMVEEDLSSMLSVLEDGVETGVVKFSKLMLKTQVPSFPLKDLPIGPCTCSPLLECYKEDLEKARADLKERAKLLDAAAKDLASQTKKHERILEELAGSRKLFQEASNERDQFQMKMCESEDMLDKVTEDLAASKQENQTLKDELTQAESHCDELETASSKVLSEVNSLNEEVKELRTREVETNKLKKRTKEVEAELELKRTEISNCEDRLKVVSEEVSYSEQENEYLHNRLVETESERDELKATSEDRLLEIDSLSQEMGELKVREELVDNLRKHIEEVEVELDRKQEEISNNEEKLKKLSEEVWLSEQENESLHDQLFQFEEHCKEVETTSSDRLSEIDSLAKELEVLRVREALMDNLKKRIEEVEVDLEVKQSEISRYEDRLSKVSGEVWLTQHEKEALQIKLGESERHRTLLEAANSEKLSEICSLSQKVEELGARERLVGDIHRRIEGMEVELAVKHREIADYEARRNILSEEVEVSRHENRSLQDQLVKLERRRSVLELASADRLSEIRSLSQKVEELSVKDEQLGKVQERVREMEVQLERKDCEFQGAKEKLLQVEYSHADIMEQLSGLEQGHDEETIQVLEQKDSEIEMLRGQCMILEESLEGCLLMSKGERESSEEGDADEGHIHQKNREVEAELVSLRAAYSDLDMKSEVLSLSNTDLRQQLGDARSASLDQTGLMNLGASSLSFSVNVDINNLQPSSATTTLTTGTNTVGVATATIPIRFESNYRRSMENGLLSAPALEENRFGGSETESEAAYLDKDYWVQRAGELSLQLQQSSAYWSKKVRELNVELEKERQFHREAGEHRPVSGAFVDKKPSGDQHLSHGDQSSEEDNQ